MPSSTPSSNASAEISRGEPRTHASWAGRAGARAVRRRRRRERNLRLHPGDGSPTSPLRSRHVDSDVTRGVRMAITAYVLIQTEVGKAANVASTVRAIDGVVAADDVTGPYDVIVRTEGATLDDIARMVVKQIQAVEGITRTFTCPVVNI